MSGTPPGGWSRRALLAALGASACVPKATPPPPPVAPPTTLPGPVRLGWRWVPGTTWRYRSVVTRVTDGVVLRRAEDWAYTALDLDRSGVVHVEGRLEAFGATVEAGGEPLPESRLREARARAQAATPAAVRLDLRLSGRLVNVSADGFADALPHRLLALHFPTAPVFPGTSWPDAGLPRAFEPALPLDVEVRAEGTTTLGGVAPSGAGWRAELVHVARLQAGDLGPALELTGRSAWDTDPGALASRTVEARWRPDQPAGGRPVGVLTVTLTRLGA
jgi:hypothetical protein